MMSRMKISLIKTCTTWHQELDLLLFCSFLDRILLCSIYCSVMKTRWINCTLHECTNAAKPRCNCNTFRSSRCSDICNKQLLWIDGFLQRILNQSLHVIIETNSFILFHYNIDWMFARPMTIKLNKWVDPLILPQSCFG